MSSSELPAGFYRTTVEYRVQVNRIRQQIIRTEWVLPDRYEIGSVLGHGAFGVVVSAVDKHTGKKVAIKRVENAFRNPDESKRLLREVKILKHMNHPNVIHLEDVIEPPSFETFQHLYFVFELASGDFAKLIKTGQPSNEDQRRRYMYDLLKALKYIHSCNVLHRDLKPGNILVSENGTVKLCDFGLARSVHHEDEHVNPEMTLYVVTRWYRGPELLLQLKRYSEAIDVWSAACIFAEMYLRTPLFPGTSYLNQITSIFNQIGTPQQSEIDEVGSVEARNWLATQPHRPRMSLATRIPDAAPEAIDLMEQMLIFHPNQRISIDDALAHPYFALIRNIAEETTSTSKLDFDFESKRLTADEIKELMWIELRDLHPELPARMAASDILNAPSASAAASSASADAPAASVH